MIRVGVQLVITYREVYACCIYGSLTVTPELSRDLFDFSTTLSWSSRSRCIRTYNHKECPLIYLENSGVSAPLVFFR